MCILIVEMCPNERFLLLMKPLKLLSRETPKLFRALGPVSIYDTANENAIYGDESP